MVGEQIGPYRILSLLGAGGMGEVYRGHDTKLGRDVALKLLPRAFANDANRRARMIREARAAAALNHPNICTVYDVGDADGQIYIAMELIEGDSLSTRLAGRALAPDDVLRTGLQIVDAVAHAHERGIVHRDLKAANIMVTSGGRVKVLDFGLAKRLTGDDVAEATTLTVGPLTAPHEIVGTLPYMSPEQLGGRLADARSDVWSLGVMFHEMASGSRPFGGKTSFETASAILHNPTPPLPSQVPGPLQSIVARCLEKEPSRRYQGAGELRAALETLATNVSHRPMTTRPRRLGVLGATAALAAVAVAALLLWSRFGTGRQTTGDAAPRIQSIAVLPLDNLSGDAGEDYFVAGMHEALITDLAGIGLQKVIAKSSVDAFKGTTKTPSEVGRELGVDGLVTGSVMRAGDRIQVTANLVHSDTGTIVWANRYDARVSDVLTLQNEVVTAIARELRSTLSKEQSARLAAKRTVNTAAYDAYLKGKAAMASFVNAPNMTVMDAAVARFEEAIRLDPTYAPPHAALSGAYQTMSQGSWRAPKDTFPRARSAALRAVELDDELAAAHAALAGVFLWFDWNWTGARREIERALQLNPDSVDALTASIIYTTLVSSQADDAARTSARIVELDPLNPFSRLQPIWVAFFSQRYDVAIANARTLVELQPNNLMGPLFLAQAHAIQGTRADVVRECRTVMKMLGDTFFMQFIAQCAASLGRIGETAEARRLLARLQRPPSTVWLDPVPMGNVYAGLGDVTRAVDWYQRGLEERSPNMIYMKADSTVDLVAKDPRFQAIVSQLTFRPFPPQQPGSIAAV